jgi:hypothetical protein
VERYKSVGLSEELPLYKAVVDSILCGTESLSESKTDNEIASASHTPTQVWCFSHCRLTNPWSAGLLDLAFFSKQLMQT